MSLDPVGEESTTAVFPHVHVIGTISQVIVVIARLSAIDPRACPRRASQFELGARVLRLPQQGQ